ncbi:MAG: nitrite reductase (NADH) large subunit, partial [Candidatus Omnitrophota bacterium]
METGMTKKVVVIGNGMVGYKFCEKFVSKPGSEDFEVVVFAEEARAAYDRVHLSEYFRGKSADDLMMAPLGWYKNNGIKLHTNDRAVKIDTENKEVTSASGVVYSYDKLVLATGSTAFVPPIKGVDKEGIFVYRTLEDLDKIMAYAKNVEKAAVIGGGLLGLEAAKALVDLKLETHVIEFAARLMPRQIDQRGSNFLKNKIEDLGVSIHLNKSTKEFEGEEALSGMYFTDDTHLDVKMVVISAGIRPRDDIARESGLKVGERGGIVVNDKLETSDPDIYAIGECALHNNFIYGLVAPGYNMAEAVACNILNEEKLFTGADMSTKLKLMGVDVASFGDPFSEGENVYEVVIENAIKGVYKKLVVDKKKNVLLGGILVGDATEYGQLLQMTQNAMTLPECPEGLIVQGLSADGTMSMDDMPDTATICSCENISKGSIIESITDGKKTVTEIKSCTKAGTGCGGCVPLITDIIDNELQKSGEAVKKILCACFDYNRVELAEIIRTEKLKNYWEVLGKYGKANGCEVCKPTVASILASYQNEFILKYQNLQETNDHFLANIQKNGTYSVVPRVPGGEITPAQLIAIGEVAAEFDLYTKITGGQRIDLFGAKVEQLPVIWNKLRSVGLESGHAYAKSLRTVKSCVGSTWCRFGVQDSVGLAIRIENRYKGLRSPHKLKSAVSGCTRECAEAQSKDFSVICTEKGYNLYVCGNGGMKPQHAQILAEDLDEVTLIKYMDRFLMYYIRTADKLTRTSVWLNKLQGGIKRLKEIVVDDCLDLAEELENEMT